MPPPPVSIYVTSLTSQPKVRQNTEMLKRGLRAMEIPFTEHDLVMDDEAKTRWQRAKPPGQVIGLPGYLVGGEWVGTMDDFEYANESGTLPTFLKQDQDFGAGDTSIGEAELEKLMREMTNEDLDALAAEVSKGSSDGAGSSGLGAGIGKIGLMTPEGSLPVDAAGDEEKVVIGSTAAEDESKSVNPLAAVLATPKAAEIGDVGKGISSAAANASETITDTAKSVVSSLAGGQEQSTAGTAISSEEPDVVKKAADAVEGLVASLDKAGGKAKLD